MIGGGMKSVYRFRGWSSPSGHGRWRGGFILCALEVLRFFLRDFSFRWCDTPIVGFLRGGGDSPIFPKVLQSSLWILRVPQEHPSPKEPYYPRVWPGFFWKKTLWNLAMRREIPKGKTPAFCRFLNRFIFRYIPLGGLHPPIFSN